MSSIRRLRKIHSARRLVSVLLMLGIGVLSGCASGGRVIETPVVLLEGIALQQLNFKEQTFQLRFNVDNPNPFPLPISSVRYKVFLEQMQFAGGETGGKFTVPANGATSFDVSVNLDLLKSASTLSSLLRGGVSRPLDYELQGSLAVAIPFTKPLNFAREGTIVVQ
ncbi:MAG: LEA type 2 family protein [Woeseia sp.]|nr:LEA type 2 family protein [Woeseia sp.]NNE61905.1 LEA type 2 family protein [Woeseia sp.]